MGRALVVEDGLSLGAFLKKALGESLGGVEWVRDLRSARSTLARETFDLVVLDLTLPDGNGTVLVTEIRGTGSGVPIIILSGNDEVVKRVQCLDLGADDYLCKPFRLDELLSRVRAVMRRAEGRATTVLRLGQVELDELSRQVRVSGEPVELTSREYDVLLSLIRSPGTVFARTTIVNAAWGWSFEGYSNVVDVHVCALRRKLRDGGVNFRAIPRVGYVLEAAPGNQSKA